MLRVFSQIGDNKRSDFDDLPAQAGIVAAPKTKHQTTHLKLRSASEVRGFHTNNDAKYIHAALYCTTLFVRIGFGVELLKRKNAIAEKGGKGAISCSYKKTYKRIVRREEDKAEKSY